MTDTELIAQQARRIAELEEEAMQYKKAQDAIHMELYGIGGPLNDNRLAYTDEQRKVFQRIGAWVLS